MSSEDGIPEEPWGSVRPCPHCGGTMSPIAWGYPLMDEALMAAAERGEVHLGGCIIPPEPVPQWYCVVCGREVHVADARDA